MQIINITDDIIYIKDAFPKWKEFIDSIEANDDNEKIHPVIPKWKNWYDSRPVKKYEDNDLEWDQDTDDFSKGKQKLFNWDLTESDNNEYWPRPVVEANQDEAHELAAPIIDLIYEDYKKCLKIWQEKTGNSDLEYISKNFTLRKYNDGGAIGPHIDKNHHNPKNTMDWTALIYLNDDYDDGEVRFLDFDISIKPEAGSIIFFPCTAVHEARPVNLDLSHCEDCGNTIGKGSSKGAGKSNKYYIFMVIHSEFGFSSSIAEPYQNMNLKILESKGITDHYLIEAEEKFIKNYKKHQDEYPSA
jgi:hypothetical protein